MELNSSKEISWVTAISEPGLETKTVFFGNGPQPIQVAHGIHDQKPSRGLLKKLHGERKGNLPISLIVAVEHGNQVSMFGPDPDTDVLTESLGRSEAILNSVISQQSEILAYQRAMSIWRSKQTTEILGFTNTGLFASHYIRSSIGKHPNWNSAEQKSQQVFNLREKELLERLGFRIQSTPSSTLLLGTGDDQNRVVAILLEQNEQFDSKSNRLQSSPVEWSLAIASEHGAPWVVAIKDSQIRLYPAKEGVGVGQKSQAETYFEIDLMMVDDENLGLLDLIFSAQSLAEGGTVEQLLADSKKFAAELGVRLRERVYESVVPSLAKEIANQLRNQGHKLDPKGLQLAYEVTLRVLFRLLFQAYAEDRGLLPAGRNEIFDSNSMKRWSEHLLDRDPDSTFGDASSIWFDLMQIWDAIDQGNPVMQIPPYNGGLFGTDPELHPTGHLIRQLSIPDRVMGPALRALVVDDNTDDGVPGAVDFRSLSVREFGTIYEGLLESSLSVADQDLTVDKKGAWVPAEGNQDVLASKDEVYFHSASGERKSTGSYYTPAFIVDYLIEKSVEPALETHLAKVKEKLEQGDQAAAYKLFFDFRVADLAMGSGHFLVAAIDKIETVMRSFLTKPGNEIDGVNGELIRLESAAKEALGKDEAAYAEIERASLLRRQIARRCIYGLDINPLAVELSRLAIWIHTFVPGLPMSSLEHNLVCANSLTGIGSVDEGLNALIPDREKHGTSLFDAVVENSLAESKKLLEDLAEADEANKKEAKQAAEIARQARAAANKSKIIFDLAVANRNGVISTGAAATEGELEALHKNEEVREWIDLMNPAHMPILFPEVFVRENSGFDALIGNPPFEEPIIEELDFWSTRFPGLKKMSNADQSKEMIRLTERYPILVGELEEQKRTLSQLRQTISRGNFPGMGVGDVDLYKAFAWQFVKFCRRHGWIGLVMSNAIWSAKGSTPWRISFLKNFSSTVMRVRNDKQWAFENVNPGYEFAFIGATKVKDQTTISVQGLLKSKDDFDQKKLREGEALDVDLILGSDENAALPSVENEKETNLWKKLLLYPGIGDGRMDDSRQDIRCAPATDIHVSEDGRKKGVFTGDQSDHPVYNHLNVDVFAFNKNAGAFNYANFDDYVDKQEILSRSLLRRRDSAMRLWGPERLEKQGHPIKSPRIVFRDVVHASNRRKAWFCLVPSNTLLTNNAPYLVFSDSDLTKQAYLLGIMNSGMLDWMTNLRFGKHLNFFILYGLPVPTFTNSKNQQRIAELSGRLALTEHGDYMEWEKFGPRIEDTDSRDLAKAEIDALVGQEFKLDLDDLRTVFRADHPTRSDLGNILSFWSENET